MKPEVEKKIEEVLQEEKRLDRIEADKIKCYRVGVCYECASTNTTVKSSGLFTPYMSITCKDCQWTFKTIEQTAYFFHE